MTGASSAGLPDPLDYNNTEPIDPTKPMIIPHLATVYLDVADPMQPTLRIVLADDYRGDLLDVIKGDEVGKPYLECNHITARANMRLAMFMESLTHHDYTGDGIPDCEHVIERIETALYETQEKPRDFRRPNLGVFTRLVMSIMPPEPQYHIVMGYGRLQWRFRKRYHFFTALMIAGFFGLAWTQNHFFPWTKYSVVSGFLAGTEHFGLPIWLGIALFFVLALVLTLMSGEGTESSASWSPHTIGFFNKAAVFEEQAFREGSENWNFQQRVRSCLAFGLIHLANLFYPLSTVIPLALGGAIFMAVYLHQYRQTKSRRTAVLYAAVVHRVYNRIALFVAAVTLLSLFGYEAFGAIVGFVAAIALGQVIVWYRKRRSGAYVPAALRTATISE